MKKRTKILLSVLGAIVIIISVTAALQWNNIKALVYFLRYSDDEITVLVQDNNELTNSAMNKIPEVTVRDLTEEERQKLDSGELSTEEVIDIIVGKSTATAPSNETTPAASANPDEPGTEASENSQERLSELLAEIYVLKARFSSSLDSLKNSAIAEYKELPAEKRTASAKQEIGFRYLQLALSMEGECDTSMNILLAEIETELKNTGGDLSLVTDIKSIYANEKSLKKAEYLSMYS